MMSFEDVANRVRNAREMFCMSLDTGEYVRTNDMDVARNDYYVRGSDVRTKAIVLNALSDSFDDDLYQFIDDNADILSNKYLRVEPDKYAEAVKKVGVSDFSQQYQQEHYISYGKDAKKSDTYKNTEKDVSFISGFDEDLYDDSYNMKRKSSYDFCDGLG